MFKIKKLMYAIWYSFSGGILLKHTARNIRSLADPTDQQQLASVDPGPLEAMTEVRHPAPPAFCPQFCRHIQVLTDLLSPHMASGWAAAPDHREWCPRTGSHHSPTRAAVQGGGLRGQSSGRQSQGASSHCITKYTLRGLLRHLGGSLFQE